MIEIRGLNKVFPSKNGPITALSDIDLEVRDGEIFGIIGLSGAGKSTLVRCMNLLERPSSGDVLVDGRSLTKMSQKELLQTRQTIGMIFQSFNLLEQRTVLQNICYPLEIAKVPKNKAVERAKELLELVSLSDRALSYPSQLSGGQKQRGAIARALATNPKYLLCDEATSALDPNTTQSILQLLKEINDVMGVTIIVITHEMRVIEQICDRVAVIGDSRIAEIGSVSEVFRSPKSEVARNLLLPQGKYYETVTGGTRLRLVFEGEVSERPIIANLVLSCQTPVNIMFADMRDIDGRAYGQTLLELPNEPGLLEKACAFLTEQGVHYVQEV